MAPKWVKILLTPVRCLYSFIKRSLMQIHGALHLLINDGNVSVINRTSLFKFIFCIYMWKANKDTECRYMVNGQWSIGRFSLLFIYHYVMFVVSSSLSKWMCSQLPRADKLRNVVKQTEWSQCNDQNEHVSLQLWTMVINLSIFYFIVCFLSVLFLQPKRPFWKVFLVNLNRENWLQ